MRPLRPSRRYKMISEFTWPNHDLPSDKDAVKRLMQGCGFDHDVAYGKTKVFIRTPRTLFSLEEQRAEMVQRIVLFLQKVSLKTSTPAYELRWWREPTGKLRICDIKREETWETPCSHRVITFPPFHILLSSLPDFVLNLNQWTKRTLSFFFPVFDDNESAPICKHLSLWMPLIANHHQLLSDEGL